MAAWHWNPTGTWSDAAHQAATSPAAANSKPPIRYILSYALPHRGFANERCRPVERVQISSTGKAIPISPANSPANPIRCTRNGIIVDLQSEKQINAGAHPVGLALCKNFFKFEYWGGHRNALDFDGGPKGEWKVFQTPAKSRMEKWNSNTRSRRQARLHPLRPPLDVRNPQTPDDEHDATDVRNCVGYAIQKIEVGAWTRQRISFRLQNPRRNPPTPTQPRPSTPGFNRRRPRRRRLPAHWLRPLLHQRHHQQSARDDSRHHGSTARRTMPPPQIAYIEKRGYPIGYIEMGEEPDR